MIRFEQAGDVWRATIERPQKANSLTAVMLNELADFATEARGQAKVFVLTGTGRVFSAGADLDEARAGLAVDPVWERLSGAIAALPCLSIAALNGTLAGGAFGMALACDLRIAVPGAKFFYPVMKLGYLPQPSDPGRMSALIGPSRSKMILMGAQKIDAQTAYDFGLVDRVVAPEDLEVTVADLSAAALAAPDGIRSGIKAMCL